jgi:hypothetical protein
MCTDFTNLNKCCPKDDFPLAMIVQIVDSTASCDKMAMLDCFSGYHPDMLCKEDEEKNQFHNTIWHVLLHENAGGTVQCRSHILQNDEGSTKGPSRQKRTLLCG